MGKILINERQLEILTEHVLFEQEIDSTISEQNISIGKTIVSGREETFKAGEPIIITMDKEATYDVNKDDPETVAGPFYDELLEKLKGVLGDNLKTKDSGLVLTSAQIDSGASNFYNRKPTLADVANDRKTPLPTQGGQKKGGVSLMSTSKGYVYNPPYKAFIPDDGMPGGKDYEANKDLALRRGLKFLGHIKGLLINVGIDVLEPLNSEVVNAKIIDTGGVIDKNRSEGDYPNPGQFITMKLNFMKEGGAGEVDDVLSCLVDMNIKVAYYRSSDKHNCDAAIFNIYMNKKYIGVANLNNYNDPSKGAYQESKASRITSDGNKKGTRVCQFIIDNAKAQEILAGSKNPSKIEMGIKGAIEGGCRGKGGAGPCDGKPTYKGVYNGDGKNRALHASIPHVQISDADGKEFYSGEPEVDMTRGDVSYKKIIVMDVCKQEVNDNVG